ncbi:MAG: hypothetical protein V1800_02450, partial [Candidatus Latescibacterota bacterium]
HRTFIGLDAPCPKQFLIRSFVSFGEKLWSNVMDRLSDDILHFSAQKVSEGLIASKVDPSSVLIKNGGWYRIEQFLEEIGIPVSFAEVLMGLWLLDLIYFLHWMTSACRFECSLITGPPGDFLVLLFIR